MALKLAPVGTELDCRAEAHSAALAAVALKLAPVGTELDCRAEAHSAALAAVAQNKGHRSRKRCFLETLAPVGTELDR